MLLPEFNEFGDLPEGIHPASLDEVVGRFGSGSAQRVAVTERLRRVYALAVATGYLDRLLVFGSYVSDVEEPNDVDVILVMRDDFPLRSLPRGIGGAVRPHPCRSRIAGKRFLDPPADATRRAARRIPGLLAGQA